MHTNSEKEHLFSNKQLAAIILPVMVQQLLTSLMGTADSIMVSSVSEVAFSAVSLVDYINVLIVQAFNALATGGVIICSNYIGQKRPEEATEAARQLSLVVLAISTGIAVICLIFRMPLLHLIFGSVSEEIMANAGLYFFITILSYPFIALGGSGGAIYQAQGNTKLPMQIVFISNLTNIAGNALLLYVFKWGVAGAAIATLFSRIVAAVWLYACLHRPNQELTVRDYLQIRPEKKKIRAILRMGIPNGIENSMFQFGKLAIQSTVSTLGTVAIAAQAMTAILENLNGMAGIGIGIGLMTVVGQCLGAGREDEARYYIKKMLKWGEVAILLSCLFVFAITKPVTILAGMSAEAGALTYSMIRFITVVKPIFWVFSFIIPYGLRAAGDVRFSMMVSSITMWAVRVALCMVLVRVFGVGLIAVWSAMACDWFVRGIIFSLRYRSGKWLKHRVV